MKKIIELVELACDAYETYFEEGSEEAYYKAMDELTEMIRERRKFEQTPITEEWLKEHGWINDYSVDECVADYTYVTFQGYIKKGDHYLLDWCNGILKVINDFNGAEFIKYDASLANLYDALELCNIKID